MKIKKVNYRIIAAALLFAAAGASAVAWIKHTQYGTPGYVVFVDYARDQNGNFVRDQYGNFYTVGAEGGVCGDPFEGTYCNSYFDQLFVNRIWAYSTPAAVNQQIWAAAYLYYWNRSSNSWVQYGSPVSVGGCLNVVGSQRQYCPMGSPASDLEPKCKNGQNYLCKPAFYNLPPGYVWTVEMKVAWFNVNTGALLAQALYHPVPGNSTTGRVAESEIRCAPYARDVLKRCAGPYNYNGYGALYMW